MPGRPGRLKPPEVLPTTSASHRDEVRVVLDILDDITATVEDVRGKRHVFSILTPIFGKTAWDGAMRCLKAECSWILGFVTNAVFCIVV